MLREVRPSNTPARRLYERKGFQRGGLRRRYYPAHDGAREDAIVMVRRLASEPFRG
jgi:ribosomal protein S18 acetylase RimI-like enzyme